MAEQQKVTLVKSNGEHLTDLAVMVVGLAALVYTLDPEPFDHIVSRVRARVHRWLYKVSVWEAQQAIRSLPETDEPS